MTQTYTPVCGSDDRCRLRMKPPGAQAGAVDGVWWPHTDDLTLEIPLLQEFCRTLGRIDRVAYSLFEWASAPAAVVHNDHRIKLDGYRFHTRHTLHVRYVNGTALRLLILPPQSAPDAAAAALSVAAQPRDETSVADLLNPHSAALAGYLARRAAEQNWEYEGGHTYETDAAQPAMRKWYDKRT
ncbi:DUF5994 family protein [Hoyosella sp. YIM 151337]|uniref:DUF5994 family protein n=1 Tax=Hoyosella sp. YIM 151337 TaxID=2992742 RepID=UPI00223678F2|nr:DUF5994 family protein [Hoyosella sp. YIM 151337]MCW4352877.1 DUF5994 family protein [Hoyosella sp. YIM 151337]